MAAVKAAMDSLDKAFVSEDVAAIKSLMTTDHIAIGPSYDGPVSIDEQLAMLARIILTERTATDRKI